MKEREINFNSSDDQTIITFNKKKKEKFLKAIKGLHLMVGSSHDDVNTDTLTEQMRQAYASLLNSYSVELLELLGYESDLVKEKKERHETIRSLNLENYELRKQLGEKATLEDMREKLKNIENKIKSWWSSEGLGHTSDIFFYGYGVTVDFSGMITEPYWNDDDDEELTIEDKVNMLIERGYEINGVKRHPIIRMSDTNIKLLTELVVNKFPSAKVNEVKAHYGRKGFEDSDIRSFKVIITDYNDFV